MYGPEKHKHTARCDRVTDIRLEMGDVELEQKSGDMDFSLCGQEGKALVELIYQFKYLGRTLD